MSVFLRESISSKFTLRHPNAEEKDCN